MLDTLNGLPVHPMLVHATVVLIPLAALVLLLAAASSRFRNWAGILPLGLTLVGLVLTPLSTISGEELEHKLAENELIEKHAELGENLIWVMLVLSLLAALAWYLGRTEANWAGLARWAAAIVGVGAVVLIALTGHSGAEAVWRAAASLVSNTL